MRKLVTWIGDSLIAIREFPALARNRAGRQIARLQDGLEPDDWNPMTGSRCRQSGLGSTKYGFVLKVRIE